MFTYFVEELNSYSINAFTGKLEQGPVIPEELPGNGDG